MLRSISFRQLGRIALLPTLVAWPVACELDSRTGRVARGSEADSGTTTTTRANNSANGTGGRAGAANELAAGAGLPGGGSGSELAAGAQLPGGSAAGAAGSGSGSGSGAGDGSEDGSDAETGSGNTGSGGAGSSDGSAGSGAAGTGSEGSAGSSSTIPGTPDEPSDPPATGARVGPAPVILGAAGTFVILAQSAITNVPFSAITGDLGISPAAASSITGFPLLRAGTSLLAPEVVGEVFAADGDPPTPDNLIGAVSDMQAAYDDAAGRVAPEFSELGDGSIGGLTLAPGLYKWTSVVSIPSDVTISGAPDDTWIFQIAGDLTLASGTRVILSGGAQARNIVWQVAGAVTLGTTSHAEGIVLSKTAIHLQTGASIDGRLLAQTAVTLAMATVSAP